ncbi:hypothetical protein OG552_23795 [Streptomyces sp. NBC_01476]
MASPVELVGRAIEGAVAARGVPGLGQGAGLAGTLLTALVLAHGPGVFLAPSMNRGMWESPATVRAVTALRADGHHVLEPVPTVSLADGLPATAVGPVPGTILTTVARLAQHRTGLRASP